MSGYDALVIDGVDVRFENADEALRVIADEVTIGTLELAGDGAGFVARRSGGDALTRPSPWGGRVTARFATRELAARALLDENGGTNA